MLHLLTICTNFTFSPWRHPKIYATRHHYIYTKMAKLPPSPTAPLHYWTRHSHSTYSQRQTLASIALLSLCAFTFSSPGPGNPWDLPMEDLSPTEFHMSRKNNRVLYLLVSVKHIVNRILKCDLLSSCIFCPRVSPTERAPYVLSILGSFPDMSSVCFSSSGLSSVVYSAFHLSVPSVLQPPYYVVFAW